MVGTTAPPDSVYMTQENLRALITLSGISAVGHTRAKPGDNNSGLFGNQRGCIQNHYRGENNG